MDIPEREIYRYLGYRGAEPGREVQALVEECAALLRAAATPRSVNRRFPVRMDRGCALIGPMEVRSAGLCKNLDRCREAYLFAATLGAPVDSLIRREGVRSVARAAVLQAAAAAMIEAYCDERQEELGESARREGLFLRPRFSPGYGDFSILHQREFLGLLEAGKRIGLSMTESSMLTPTKSVTAVIGLGEEPLRCPRSGCGACAKRDCAYRRED